MQQEQVELGMNLQAVLQKCTCPSDVGLVAEHTEDSEAVSVRKQCFSKAASIG